MRIQTTICYGLHGDPCSILPIALLIELDHRPAPVPLRRVDRVQAALMGAQLLHRSSTKGVAGCNQHGEAILDQPERDLR